MATTDKAKNSAQQAKAKAKESVGNATDSDNLQAEGDAEMDHNLRQAGFNN